MKEGLSLNNLLINYYNNNNQLNCNFHYPLQEMLLMMTSNNKYSIQNRILMIELHDKSGTPFFKRNFEKNDKTIEQILIKEHPSSIHMGKIYTNIINTHVLDLNPINKDFIHPPIFTKEEKDIVFDIDASDYDMGISLLHFFKAYGNLQVMNTDEKKLQISDTLQSLRVCSCKSKKTACSLCWYLMGSASIVIKYFMVELFNINNFLWVYSGNRGVHCWIRDNQLISLDENMRKCLIDIMMMNTDENIFNNLTNHYDLFDKLFSTELYPYFKKMIISNHILKLLEPLIFLFITNYYKLIEQSLKDNWDEIDQKISLLNDENDIYRLNLEKWTNFENFSKNIKWTCNNNILPEPYKFIVFRLLYPIFDSKVTSQIDHLLKLPFSIHKTTKRLSFPIAFDEIPTLPIDNTDFIKRISIENHYRCKKGECGIDDIMTKSKYLINDWLNK